MILIIGLGNPGEGYKDTRHNAGFLVLDSLLKKLTSVEKSVWAENKKLNCLTARVGEDLLLAKPLSFMNAAGEVVAKLVNFYKIPPFGLYLVHDDVDLPLGKIKISLDRGSAGHKGVESVIEKLGTKNFVRIRVGVGKDRKIRTERFVLSPFMFWEREKLRTVVKKAVGAIEIILREGAERAANRYNQ